MYLLYSVELGDFLVSNYWLGLSTLSNWDFNNLLTNNLNKYHPHIFYISTIWCVSVVTINSNYLWQWKLNFGATYLNNLLVKILYASGLINYVALFLGSWWAFQEGTWGGWWNWDPSEVLGLLVLLLSLLGLHHFSANFQIFKLTVKVKIGAILFILVYFFTQLNFDLVSHNFGNRFTFFFTNTLFYLESASTTLLVSFITLFLILSQSLQKQNFRLKEKAPRQPLTFLVSTSCIGLWLTLTSFLPLCNYFLWQYLHLNIFNIVINHQLVLFYLTLIIYVVFSTSNVSYLSITTLSLGIHLPTFLIAPLLINSRPSYSVLLLHLLILTQLILNIVVNQLDLMTNSTNSLSTEAVLSLNLLYSETIINVCEDVWRETSSIRYSHHTTPYLSTTFSTTSNIAEVNSFLLIQDDDNFTNLYQISNYYIRLAIEILTPYFSNLYETVLITLVLFAVWGHSRWRISI